MDLLADVPAPMDCRVCHRNHRHGLLAGRIARQWHRHTPPNLATKADRSLVYARIQTQHLYIVASGPRSQLP